MHYCCLVFTKEFPSEEVLSAALKPFDEDGYYTDDEEQPKKDRPVFMWDWYQIGGRYSGGLRLRAEELTEKYRWYYYEREPRNGRLFWSYLITKVKEFAKDSFMFHEEDYFSSMGLNDGILYVDAALVSDLKDFDKAGCYYAIDKDGVAYSRDFYSGEKWHTNENFDTELAKVKAENADCYVTVVDLHD